MHIIMLKLSLFGIILSLIIIQVILNPQFASAKKLITIGENRKTSLTPFHTMHTVKSQQCFSRCHYNKKCYSMEIIQTTLYHCNFYDRGLKFTDLNAESPNTKVYLQVRDCQDLYNLGIRHYGSYEMSLFGDSTEYLVPCHFDSDGGWIVFQRHIDGRVVFNRGWDDYKNGFGDFKGSFWLGNELLHKITNHQKQQTKIEISSFSGASTTVKYGSFKINDENNKYQLQVSGLMNGGLNVFETQYNMRFTTFDSDNDLASHNCAEMYNRGGFWYEYCGIFKPNGIWLEENDSYKPIEDSWIGMRLSTLSPDYTLNSTLMMIKPAVL
ncbi:microfibril-associated glycoprotein 4-like [Clytia hemisphaerica]|uniref:Fibrinogen C-terminal domain-containing protein n=1 Tax=Clytia hemisphaerica TaxID=252671 RepID=A0A7M5V8A6_9CNID